tara:strand:+ start:355 stop:537 length:183 start_codon:yes stop_codon:yes gene_type:complete
MTIKKFRQIPLVETAELQETIQDLRKSLDLLQGKHYADGERFPEKEDWEPTDYESVTHGH